MRNTAFGNIAVLLMSCTVAVAADPPEPGAKTDTNEGRLEEMKQRLNEVLVVLDRSDSRSEQLIDQPLIRFNDPTRAFLDGGVWAVGSTGRPAMLATLERYHSKWAWELISLSSDKVYVDLPDGWKWRPEQPGLDLQEIPDAERPSDNKATRLRQMKVLVRRFSASERGGDNQTYELRLLPQPIHRYGDEDQGIIDGALFVFANGTNPEVLVVLECESKADGDRAWKYGFAPLTTAPAMAKLDDEEVWSKPQNSLPKRQEPYTYFAEPAIAPEP